MASSASPLSSTFHHVQLTPCDFQSRTNVHGIFSITTLWHIRQCTTHFLSFPEQNKWHHQHHYSDTCHNEQLTLCHFQSRTNGHGTISTTTLWHIPQYTTHSLSFPEEKKEHGIISITTLWYIHNVQLTPCHFQRRKQDMASSASPLSGTFHNVQLTLCHFQRRNNGHGIISITTVWYIPKCTTYPLPFAEKNKCTHHQHHHCLPNSTMYNSHPIISRKE
jgi:hypothetical protein